MTKHTEWFEKITRGDSNRRVADLAQISDATLGRQLRSGELAADLIIRVAEAYDESPVIALVDLGFMSAKWITEPGIVTALSRADDEQLTDELLRRLNLLDKAPADEVAERRRKRNPPVSTPSAHDGTVTDWDDSQPFAADSSPDEGGTPDDYIP